MRPLHSFLLVACTAVFAGCPAPVPPELSAIEQRIFAPSCTFSSCHSVQGHAGQLVLVPGRSFGDLVGKPCARSEAQARGLLRVAPGDLLRSFLFTKLQDPLDPALGDRMPLHGAPLEESERAAIAEWIRLGALDN